MISEYHENITRRLWNLEGKQKQTMGDVNVAGIKGQSLPYRFIKRLADIVLSLVGLILLSPIFLITAIAIKLEDGGSVFYVQDRIGKNKNIFKMYKFRSMKMDADKMHEQMKKEYGVRDVSFKLKEDPRETRVGRVIRKWNIDELPQLLNILKGEMTFVGPRPLPVYEYEDEQKRYNGKYDLRYEVPQGLTCTWQIGNRSETEYSERMQMDVDYARRCGLLLDTRLFFLTAIYSITGKAAY